LTGTTSFGDIAASEENKRLASDIFADRILDFVGAYYLKLESVVDALVFADGIGEKILQLREKVSKTCTCLEFELNQERNASEDEVEPKRTMRSIGSNKEKQILVCETEEQFEMARQCMSDTGLYSTG
jgi:acetate kinase